MPIKITCGIRLRNNGRQNIKEETKNKRTRNEKNEEMKNGRNGKTEKMINKEMKDGGTKIWRGLNKDYRGRVSNLPYNL